MIHPYQCDFCIANFDDAFGLRKHIATWHPAIDTALVEESILRGQRRAMAWDAIEPSLMGEPYRTAFANAAADEGKPTNPKDRAATARLPMSLFPDSARAYGALALAEGDLKYGGYNWRSAGALLSVYIDALDRHRTRFMAGEWADKKTGVPHLASMLACVAIIIDAEMQGKLRDDRPPAQPRVLAFLDECEETVKRLQGLFANSGAKRYTEKDQGDDE